jgi:hypothetical protein
MSKLAHSHQPTMDEIDIARAIENGDDDLLTRAEDDFTEIWLGKRRFRCFTHGGWIEVETTPNGKLVWHPISRSFVPEEVLHRLEQFEKEMRA